MLIRFVLFFALVGQALATNYAWNATLLTSTATVTNSVGGDFAHTGISWTIPSGVVAGTTYNLYGAGRRYATAATARGYTAKLYKAGSAWYQGVGLTTTPGALVDNPVTVYASIRILTTGAGGTALVSCFVNMGDNFTTTGYRRGTPKILSIDTTVSNAIDLRGAWGATGGETGITVDSASLQYTGAALTAETHQGWNTQLLTSTTHVTNSATSDQAFTGITWTIPAGTATVGAIHDVAVMGHRWGTVATSRTIASKLYLGGALVHTGIASAAAITANAADNPANAFVHIQFLSLGASGTALVTSVLTTAINNAGDPIVDGQPVLVTVNTTADQVWDLRGAWTDTAATTCVILDAGVYQWLNP